MFIIRLRFSLKKNVKLKKTPLHRWSEMQRLLGPYRCFASHLKRSVEGLTCFNLTCCLRLTINIQTITSTAKQLNSYICYALIYIYAHSLCFLLHSMICVFVCVYVCSSENTDGSRRQAHKEVMITVAEMKKRIPSDKRSRSKASTVEALHYALNCVKQVQGNQATR